MFLFDGWFHLLCFFMTTNDPITPFVSPGSKWLCILRYILYF